MRPRLRPPQEGYSLVVLLVTIAVMLVLMSAAMPSWRYLAKNDREEELIFRGGEIADAIARFQSRNGNALPTALDVLVKGKFLRHAYKDPMTKDGNWRFLPPNEMYTEPPRGGAGTSTTTTTTRPSAFSQTGMLIGGFRGVASRSTEKGLRLFNGQIIPYKDWRFSPGFPRIIGRQPVMQRVPPGATPLLTPPYVVPP